MKRSNPIALMSAVLFSTTTCAQLLGVQTNLGSAAGTQLAAGSALNNAVNTSVQTGVNSSLITAVNSNNPNSSASTATNIGLSGSAGAASSVASRPGTISGGASGSISADLNAAASISGSDVSAAQRDSLVWIDHGLAQAKAKVHEQSLKNLAEANARLIARKKARVTGDEQAAVHVGVGPSARASTEEVNQ